MAILQVVTDVIGLIGVQPQNIYIKTTDTLAEVMTPGYLNQVKQQGYQLSNWQIAEVYGVDFNNGHPGSLLFQVQTPANPSTGNYSLVSMAASGEVVLPVTPGHLASFVNTAGAIQDSNAEFTGGHAFSGILTADTTVTFPTSGTLATTAQIPNFPVSPANGGTGVNNGTSTITVAGNTQFSGAHNFVGTLTADTNVTFPTSGTLITSASLPTLPLSIANGGTSKTAVPVIPAATTYAGWDANKNLSANSFIEGFTNTVTANGNTVLTVASAQNQFFSGTNTQQIQLPATSTLVLGQSFYIYNNSTLPINIETADNSTLPIINSGTSLIYTCISTASDSVSAWAWSVFGGDTANLGNNLFAAVALSPTNVHSMYATPFSIFTNNDSSSVIFIEKCILDIVYLAGTLAGGGNVRLQYGNTANAGGPAASTSVPATAFQAISESCTIRMDGYQPNPLNNSASEGQSIYITNDTAAFTSGSVEITAYIWYTQLEV